jgi:hypothetical protein
VAFPNPTAAGQSRDGDVWVGEGLRREVFFFDSRGVRLYGSLFAAVEISQPFGVVACNSWGVEADRADPLQRSVALEMARRGGAGLVFHYPGYGDSYGDLAALDLTGLTEAAIDAHAEAARRCPDVAWTLAGFMLGAAVACLAQQHVGVERLLLVQPTLRPGGYFQWLSERTQPIAPGPSPRELLKVGTTPGMAYGYPIPRRIAESAAEADMAVDAALGAFDGGGAVVRQEKPAADPVPGRFEEIEVPGTWRFGSLDHSQLAKGAVGWLDRLTRDGDR